MTEERRSRGYARRRDLRATPSGAPAGPVTQELVLHRDGGGPDAPLPPVPEGREGAGPPWDVPPPAPDGPHTANGTAVHPPAAAPPPLAHGLVPGGRRRDRDLQARRPSDGTALVRVHDGDDRGGRLRTSVERWARWASGLGRPPRDVVSGRRHYPRGERMLAPGLLIAAGLGVAALIGLLTGILVTAPRDAAAAGAAGGGAPTVTVTEQVTPPVVTETRTRTRTRTTTVTASPEAPAPVDGGVLALGAQGPAVTQLQQDLAELQIYQGQPTGTFDEPTRAAVQSFQARFGVTQDEPGVAGPATLAALAQELGRT